MSTRLFSSNTKSVFTKLMKVQNMFIHLLIYLYWRPVDVVLLLVLPLYFLKIWIPWTNIDLLPHSVYSISSYVYLCDRTVCFIMEKSTQLASGGPKGWRTHLTENKSSFQNKMCLLIVHLPNTPPEKNMKRTFFRWQDENYLLTLLKLCKVPC